MYNFGLVLEGGGMRGLYSAGVLDFLIYMEYLLVLLTDVILFHDREKELITYILIL